MTCRDASFLALQERGLIGVRWHRERVDLRSFRSEHDKVHGEALPRVVPGVEKGPAASVGVQWRQRVQAAHDVPPLFRLPGPGNEDLEPLVSGIADDQPTVRRTEVNSHLRMDVELTRLDGRIPAV